MRLAKESIFSIRHRRGWKGAFTRDEAILARYRNGTRVKKSRGEPGDSHPVGTLGTVLGSVYMPPPAGPFDLAAQMAAGVAYFIEWDTDKKTACFVVEWKLARA